MPNWMDAYGLNNQVGNSGFSVGDAYGLGSAFGGGSGGSGWMSTLGSSIGGALPYLAQSLGLKLGQAKNPATGAMKYLEKVPETVSPFYQPYISAGTNALGPLQDQYAAMMKDPSAIIERLGSRYTPSAGYKFNLQQGLKAGNQAAAAGGMAGSPAEQAEMMKYAQGLASQDYGDYLNRALGLYGGGVQGYEGLTKQGYGASDTLAQILAAVLGSQSKLSFEGQNAQNKMNAGLLGGLGSLLGSAFGGGSGGSSGGGSDWLGTTMKAAASILPFFL